MTRIPRSARSGKAAPAKDVKMVATALWVSSLTSQLADDLAGWGIPVMVLKGPPLQRRLLSTEGAYPSVDVDLLVPRHQAGQARRMLRATGWKVQPGNGVLWRLDRAIAFERKGVVIDLHWGIHLGVVPPWTLTPLEQGLWAGASRAEGGWWEPRTEPLLVYLALHAAAFGFSKPAGLMLVEAAAGQVSDWGEMEAISRRIGAWPAVAHAVGRALGDATTPAPPLLSGMKGRLLLTCVRLLRSGLVPEPARRALRISRDQVRSRFRGRTKRGPF